MRAQQRLLTLDDIYDPRGIGRFAGTSLSGLAWMDGTTIVWPRRGTNGTEWSKIDAANGVRTPLFDPARMEASLAKLPGFSAADARRLASSRDLVFDEKYSAALLTLASDLYVYMPASDRAVRLTSSPGEKSLASFSPDGRVVAFVCDNNLFVVDVASARERQLTTDGTAKVLNGILDWVYEEEIYGRGNRRAYWWSPDSSRLAFLQIDDTLVPTSTTVDSIPYEPTLESFPYPKAGDPNPIAKLGVVRVAGGPVSWADRTKYSASDSLIVRVSWTPDSHSVAYQVQNRTQTWLDLNQWAVSSRSVRTIFRETSPHWIASDDAESPTWLKDGSFLWLSARSGWRHIYHYRPDGTLVRQITEGPWEVRTLHGVDSSETWLYFSGTEHSPIGLDVYRTKLDGTGRQRLSPTDGTHVARFSPTFTTFLDRWSDAMTPPQLSVWRNDGQIVRVIERNPVAALAEYRLSKPEFVQVPTRDGFVMEAMILKPPDFDPARRYPVYQFAYGGPQMPSVRNAWGGSQFLYHQLLAERGIIVWVCDNRSASGKGAQSAWQLDRRFGQLELKDIEDGLEWLKRQPYVDASRVGIGGWSYGGFLTAYALTHSTSFVMGIAGGTVSDWRDYDSVYTERYLGLPQENPDGYRESSPRWSGSNLRGALMLVHGEMDDNVHVSNTLQLAHELQIAQKRFQMMIYPKSRHGVTDPALVRHLRAAMLEFTLEHLKPGTARD